MRSIALDVDRDFCEVAIKDESGLRLTGQVKTTPRAISRANRRCQTSVA